MAEKIYTNKSPEPIGPYSQAIKIDNLIYTSGQVAIDPATGQLSGDIKEQTRQAIRNIEYILQEAGSGLSKVVKTTVFLKNMNDFTDMNEVYAAYFSKNKPARSTVEVSRLPKDALVEIEAIAEA